MTSMPASGPIKVVIFLLGLVEIIVSSANLQVQMAGPVFCGYVVYGISLDKDI
jgi:hypothetical protein